jgi:hypothetical protein
MIPHTYPSILENNTTKMVISPITDLTGLQRWVDYIPIKGVSVLATDKENIFSNNGYIVTQAIDSLIGKQSWVDYIPVFVDNLATDAWEVSALGFIPVSSVGIIPVSVSFLSIQDSNATPENIWTAADSTDDGNNLGWTFV